MNSPFKTKRIYEEPSEDDGYRMLIDRLWPRGIKKEEAKLNEWNKDVAPSDNLRKWFDHQDERFEEFVRLYKKELDSKKEVLDRIINISQNTKITFLYATKYPNLSHASVLLNYLKNRK